MSVDFTTDALDERDRIPFWVDVASKTFYAHSFDAPATNFTGTLRSRNLDSLALTVCDCAPCEVTRTRRDTLRDDIDCYMFSIRLEGRSLLTQDDQTHMVAPGTVMLHNASQPVTLNFIDDTRSLHLIIPRRLMQGRLGDRNTTRFLSVDTPEVGLAVDFIQALNARTDQLDASLMPRLADQLVELVSLALGGANGEVTLSTARANALRRVKAEIEKRLCNPNLTPSLAAAAGGVSVRYANALLAEQGSSLERYIQQRRLEHCRHALEDPLQSHRMISEIAFAWGFSDHSHFTRRFRDAFGMTPRECRQLASYDPS